MTEIETRNFLIRDSLTEEQIHDLIYFSNNDVLIGEFTQDRARFNSIETFEMWRAKERRLYVILTNEEDLGGLIWFGNKKLPETDYAVEFDKERYEVTFAIRLYEKLRGRGLAREILSSVFSDYVESLGEVGIWLEVFQANSAAVRLYESFGFFQVSDVDALGKIVMVWDEDLSDI